MTVPPGTRERTRTARHRPPLAGQAHGGQPRGSGPVHRPQERRREGRHDYPTFYSQLYPDLRAELTTAVGNARDAKAGVWAADATTGATINALADLTDQSSCPSCSGGWPNTSR